MIDDVELARALHVLCIAHWIGGVAFVTLIVLPLARASAYARNGWSFFEAIEGAFAAQARWSVPLAGASGLWMTARLGLWGAFGDPEYWWMDAMAGVWTLFMFIIFIAEPIVHRRIATTAARAPELVLRRLFFAHLALLTAAAIAIVGAVTGSHGGLVR